MVLESLFMSCFLHVPGWSYWSLTHTPSSFTSRKTPGFTTFTSMVEVYIQLGKCKIHNRWYLLMPAMVLAVWKVISYWEVTINYVLFYFSFSVTLEILKLFHQHIYATTVCGSCPLLNPGNNQQFLMPGCYEL